MCWPTCRGGAYLAASVFIYRSILIVITMISSSITRLKSTYLPITTVEELLLQLIYFIPLFTSSSFVLIGIESNSFTYTLYSTVCLSLTLFLRYCLELAYIYTYQWEAFLQKTPQLYLNIIVDLAFIILLILYVKNRLRNLKSLKHKSPWNSAKHIYAQEVPPSVSMDDTTSLLKIHNDLSTTPEEVPVVKNINEVQKGRSGVGQGVGEGVALHYPPIVFVERERLQRPLPPLPRDELDDVSLPPPIPLASLDYDDI